MNCFRNFPGNSTATTLGRNSRICLRTSAANSTRPGTTGTYVMWPCVRLISSEPRDIPQRFLAQDFKQRQPERLVPVDHALVDPLELAHEAGNVDAVTHGVTLVGHVRLLQKIGDVIQ